MRAAAKSAARRCGTSRVIDIDPLYADVLKPGRRGGRGLSMTTAHHIRTALNELSNVAEHQDASPTNVVRLSTHPTLTATRLAAPEMTVWTPDELVTFLHSIDRNRSEAILPLAAVTGTRRGELVGLRWTDMTWSVARTP